jgi:hypothetical protein
MPLGSRDTFLPVRDIQLFWTSEPVRSMVLATDDSRKQDPRGAKKGVVLKRLGGIGDCRS